MKKFLDFFESMYVTAKRKVRETQWMRLLKIGIGVTIAVLLIFTIAGSLVESQSMFTISFMQESAPSGGGDLSDVGNISVSLSETYDFAVPTVALDAGGMENMTNISERWIPEDVDSSYEGSHNGDGYIAYTFYIKNTGDTTCTLKETIHLDSSLLDAEAAIRVRVYRNGEEKTYAKSRPDGTPEYGTIPFVDDETICNYELDEFAPEQIKKYTLVIWLEGDDPECLDNIKGGNVKMSMTFTA